MPKCVNCGREIAEWELKQPGTNPFGSKHGYNLASLAPKKCNQCGAWICSKCQIAAEFAQLYRAGGLKHHCGGTFEYQD